MRQLPILDLPHADQILPQTTAQDDEINLKTIRQRFDFYSRPKPFSVPLEYAAGRPPMIRKQVTPLKLHEPEAH
jgi:hypothetical protein